MKELEHSFTTRQYMVSPDFEFYHYKDDPSLEVEYHNHNFYEIYFLISGRVNYIVEGKNYSLKPGDIMLVNDMMLHKPVIQPGCIYERIVLWINPDYIRKQSTEDAHLFMCFESSSKTKYNVLRPDPEMLGIIKNIFLKLNKSCSNTGFGNNILKNVYLTELIVYLNKAHLETCDEDIEDDIIYDPKINEIINYINKNLGEVLTLEALSAKFFTSKYHLLREFKKHTGFTLHNYIQKKRLITAKTLLRNGIRITEICQLCGFGDYSNFIRSFRKAFGMSPKKFYKSNTPNSPWQ